MIPADSLNPITVLTVRMQQEKDLSTTSIDCGAIKIARNWAKDYPIDFPYVVCTDNVVVSKTGNDISFVSITYVPYNIHETASFIETPGGPFSVSNNYSFGELTIALILIPIAGLILYQTILQAFRKPIIWHK